MPIPVSLREVAEMVDACPQGWSLHLERKTGELHMLPGETSDAGQDDEESQKLLERLDTEPDAFVTLPEQREMREYDIMERFCESIEDERKRERLLDAISGKGAFGRFKDMIVRVGVRDDWFAFKERAYAKEIREFLKFKDIAFKDDVGRG